MILEYLDRLTWIQGEFGGFGFSWKDVFTMPYSIFNLYRVKYDDHVKKAEERQKKMDERIKEKEQENKRKSHSSFKKGF